MRYLVLSTLLTAAAGCGPIDITINPAGDGTGWNDPTTGTPETTGSTGLGGSETGEPSEPSDGGSSSSSSGEGSSSGEASGESATTTGSTSESSESSGTTGEPECVPGLPCWCNDLVPPQPCPSAAHVDFLNICVCYTTSDACVCPSGVYDLALCEPC